MTFATLVGSNAKLVSSIFAQLAAGLLCFLDTTLKVPFVLDQDP